MGRGEMGRKCRGGEEVWGWRWGGTVGVEVVGRKCRGRSGEEVYGVMGGDYGCGWER